MSDPGRPWKRAEGAPTLSQTCPLWRVHPQWVMRIKESVALRDGPIVSFLWTGTPPAPAGHLPLAGPEPGPQPRGPRPAVKRAGSGKETRLETCGFHSPKFHGAYTWTAQDGSSGEGRPSKAHSKRTQLCLAALQWWPGWAASLARGRAAGSAPREAHRLGTVPGPGVCSRVCARDSLCCTPHPGHTTLFLCASVFQSVKGIMVVPTSQGIWAEGLVN